MYAISFIHPYFIHSLYPIAVFKASCIPGLEMDTGEDHDQLAQSDGRVTYKQTESPEQGQRRWHGCLEGLAMAPDTPGGATWGRKGLVKGGSHLGGPQKS